MSDTQMLPSDLELAIRAGRAHRAVLILDPAGRIVAANQSYLNMCGYRRDELISEPVDMLLDRFERRPGRLARMLDMQAGQDCRIDGLGQVSKAGRHFRVDVRICPIRDDQGGVCLIALFMSESAEEEGPLRALAPQFATGGDWILSLPRQDSPKQFDELACAAGYGQVFARCGS